MSSNVVNQVAYLRTSRKFPEEIEQLTVEINKSYLEIAAAVNARTIGIYPQTRPAITGDSYFLKNQRQQSIRQIYTFTATTAIPHGLINIYSTIPYFTKMYGQYQDNVNNNWYGLPAATTVAIPGQITFYIDTTNINFVIGAGAPALKKGIIVLEWLSNI